MFYDFPAEETEIKMLTETLFRQGKALECGGAVGGLLSLALKKLFSVYGAFPAAAGAVRTVSHNGV